MIQIIPKLVTSLFQNYKMQSLVPQTIYEASHDKLPTIKSLKQL